MGDAHERNFPEDCKRWDRSYETYLRGLFSFVAQQKSEIDALSRKNLKVFFFAGRSLSSLKRSLHFESHCTVFTREKSRWLTVVIL